jgi:DNA-binding MarR family transcriptional regulator
MAKQRSMGKAAKQPGSDARQENWDQRLGFLMHDVSRLRRKVFDEAMKPEGITRSQWWVLAYLSRYDGISQSDLAESLEIGRAALGGLVDRLEAMGLVRRAPHDSDRRAKLVYLTAEGSNVIDHMRVKSDQMSEAILAGLTWEQRHQWADRLDLVKHNLLKFK